MDRRDIHTDYCQSCGMPLRPDMSELRGTNADRSASDEFCHYCLRDGCYTVDIPMAGMVEIWARHTDKYNEYAGTRYTPAELRTLLRKRLPTLGRWRQRAVTDEVHRQAVGVVCEYVGRNLHREIDPEDLCRISHCSFYHLRRVFRNATGENIGAYITRLRMEDIAHKLINTRLTIGDIVRESNYQSRASLAKAFRHHFGIPMTEYRQRHAPRDPVSDQALHPEIRKLEALRAICSPVGQAFRSDEEYAALWSGLLHHREAQHNAGRAGEPISISLDNPQVTAPDRRRLYIGYLTTATETPGGKFGLRDIPGGTYAVFRHRGSYRSLAALYRTLYARWLPQSGYVQREPFSFEIYRNSPLDTPSPELVTEVHIPIDKPST